MELPRRARGDELLKPGELLRVRQSLRRIARRHDIKSVITCASVAEAHGLAYQPASGVLASL